MTPFVLFGGTFDPVHNGHIQPLITVADQLGVSEITLMPCFVSPHKSTPNTTNEHRLAMLRLATANHSLFHISEYEINQATPSYTVQTLRHYKHRQPEQALLFLMGADSFLNFTRWYQWQEILQLSNILVLARPGYDYQEPGELAPYKLDDPTKLAQSPNGKFALIESPLFNISSTEIREKLTTNEDLSELIPESVLNYIQTNHLYK